MKKPSRKASSAARRKENREKRRKTRARPVIPGRRYKITRRCFDRRFFLTPDTPLIEQMVGYLLGYCVRKYGLLVHAACFMGNHYHLDVTDVRGNFPAFKSAFNGLLARSLNAHRGRFELFWSGDRGCDVELVDDDDVVDRMAYTIANPVSGGLVPRSTRWPGFTTAGLAFGTRLTFQRPDHFFDSRKGKMPKSVELEVVRPAVMMHLSDEELMCLLETKVHEREKAAAEKLKKENRRFLLESRILKQHWNSSPTSREDRFTTKPKVAGSCKWKRIAAQQRNKRWEDDYVDARDADKPGETPTYPYGTYQRRLYGGVVVASPPS